MAQARIGLQYADAEARGNAQKRAHHAENIHAVAEPAIGAPPAEHRHQSRAQSQRQVLTVGEISQRHADQRINAPAVQTPMQKCLRNGRTRRFGRAAAAIGRGEVMRQRLGCAEKQQINADAGGKQHRRPGEKRKIGLIVILPELDVAIARQPHIKRKQAVGRHHQHVIPAEMV